MARLPLLVLWSLTLVLTGCDLLGDDEPLPFPWAKDGARMVYDFHPVEDKSMGDSIRHDVYTYAVSRSEEADYLELKGDAPQPFGNNQLTPFRYSMGIRRKKDGLHSALLDCLNQFPEKTQFMLRVPAEPENLLKMPRRDCPGVTGFYMVLEEDTTVTVPAGTFDTFMQQFRGASDVVIREYWNEKEGLIKIELFSDHGETHRAYYELSSKNF